MRRTPADFDGDGVGDLAVATREGVRAYYGTRGRLVLRAGAVIPYPADVPADRAALAAVGDLDGDGTGELAVFARSAQTTPDLPSSPFRSGALYVVSGSRAGLVSGSARRVPAPPAVVDLFPSRVRAAGRLRGMAAGLLAVATHRGGGVALFERRGDGSFETVGGLLEARPGASNLFARGAGDLDGDGFEDLALFHEGEALVYGGGADGASTARRQVFFTDAANYVGPYLDGVGDVTGDGCPDLLLLRFGPDDGFILFAGGAGFGAGSPWAPAAPGGAALRVNGTTDFFAPGDADGDGIDDVVVSTNCFAPPCPARGRQFALYRGARSGLATAPIVLDLDPTGTMSVAPVGDLDGDGRGDLGGLPRGGGALTLWHGTPAGYVASARTELLAFPSPAQDFTGSNP